MDYTIRLPDYWRHIGLDTSVLPPACSIASAVDAVRNRAYLFGGLSPENRCSARLSLFDMDTEKILPLGELDIPPRFNHRMFLTRSGRLCIIGGMTAMDEGDPSRMSFTDDAWLADPATGRAERLPLPEGLMRRGQFTASLDAGRDLLYVFGGFGKADLFRITLPSGGVEFIPDSSGILNARAGMVSEVLPDGRLFIFSGFDVVRGRPVCYNDILLYNPETGCVVRKECHEILGRTFAKSFFHPESKRVMMFGGTWNGLENSGALLYYASGEDRSGYLPIRVLPDSPVEPCVFYSGKNDRMYVLSGLQPTGPETCDGVGEVIILDFAALPPEAWILRD